ncbi:hypothetical protein F8M41_009002 [Gigaspora margarita]|uniref:Uncharacterized protein n=1 Tax=Gigaspora margarita TaxID=4874 RepID=A0A8H4AVD2_GIGMA|nr:hypothetical protein F8M41_009002 [Gigaspora margarita]
MTISEDEEENLEVENKIEQPANLQGVNNLQETESIYISATATEVNTWDKLNALIEIEEGDDFSEGCSQLALILDSIQQSRNLSIEMDVGTGVVNRMLKVSELVNQRRHHDAYTGQRMERRVAGVSTSAPNNRYSSLVLYLSSNESAQPGIPHQNHWKIRARLEQLNDETRSSVNGGPSGHYIIIMKLVKDYRSEWGERAKQFISKEINDLEIEEIVIATGEKVSVKDLILVIPIITHVRHILKCQHISGPYPFTDDLAKSFGYKSAEKL